VGDANVAYLDRLLAYLFAPAALVFDDFSWPSMRPTWGNIVARHVAWEAMSVGN